MCGAVLSRALWQAPNRRLFGKHWSKTLIFGFHLADTRKTRRRKNWSKAKKICFPLLAIPAAGLHSRPRKMWRVYTLAVGIFCILNLFSAKIWGGLGHFVVNKLRCLQKLWISPENQRKINFATDFGRAAAEIKPFVTVKINFTTHFGPHAAEIEPIVTLIVNLKKKL